MSVEARFDPVVHPVNRLRICAMLAEAREVEFATLRDALGVSDSVLSKQLTVLGDAGYVVDRRATRAGRQRVRLALTGEGRTAYAGHLAALQEIVGPAEDRSVLERPTPAPGAAAAAWLPT